MRAVRASVFAALTVVLAATAHRLAGGSVSGIAVVGAGAVMWLFALAVSGRERRGRFVSVTVLVSQLGLHLLFTFTEGGSGPSQTTLWGKLLLCHHGAQPLSKRQIDAARALIGASHTRLPVPTLPGPSVAAVVAEFANSWSAIAMLAAHLLAAGAMAWWLRRGERAAWAAAHRVAVFVARQLSTSQPLGLVGRSIWAAVLVRTAERATGLLWVTDCSERGPPTRLRLVLI